MRRLPCIKTCFLRCLSVLLLTVSTGFVVLPESNPYSADKTFVKSHAPASDNFEMLRGADREGVDEDGLVDVQVSTELLSYLISFDQVPTARKMIRETSEEAAPHRAYIIHRQLLI